MRRTVATLTLGAALSLSVALGATACNQNVQAQDTPAEEVTEGQKEDVGTSGEDVADKDDDTNGTTNAARDPADPPQATLACGAEEVHPLACSSTWTFEQDGETMTVTTDAPHPVQYEADGMPAANVDEPTEVTASFDEPATFVDVTRYAEDDLAAASEAAGSAQDVAASDVIGEIIDAGLGEDGTVSLAVEPGYRYALEVGFENGICMYVFTVR